ncbi:type IV secretory system conjugative DNA transfer family protein [Cytobacillus sp. FSL M8-0252]|uniref:VirD4-like conjugal transfer protein, CD1115 family n=1 Tax=Cytobacillus sp. FSL M8-0252 TaxID=2921621 RepID=UPI0030F8376B
MANKKEKSRLVDGIIGIVFSLVVAYLGVSALRMLLDSDGTFIENILSPNESIEWLLNSEIYIMVVILAITFGTFVLFMNGSSKKDSGYKDASEHGAYGNAAFSYAEDLREVGFIAEKKESKFSEKDPLITLQASEGIILGRQENQLVIIPPDSKLDNRNVYVVGSSGSAKGQAFVINNILNAKSDTIVVTDPKGELHKLTSDIKKDQGFKVYQIDFLNLKGDRYNPLDYVKNDFDAIKLATTISVNSAKDVKQDFFFNTAKDLLTGLIIYVSKEKDRYIKPSISREVKGLFNKISEDEEFLKKLSNEIGVEHPSYQYFKDASVATGNTRTSILQSFAQQTGIFSLGDVAQLTSDSDFSFFDLQEQKSILYVKVPIKLNPVPALTALFFDQLFDTLYWIGDQNDSKLHIPTIFMLDEFANLGKINGYDNILSTCRGYEMSLITIVQDFAQMEQLYSKEIARTIVSNHDTTLFLRTKDQETAKYFETLAGNTTIKFKTKGTSGSGGFMDILLGGNSSSSRSTNEQIVGKPLISQDKLLNMSPTDKCYVFMTGHVIELKKAYQWLIYKDFITKQDGKTPTGKPKFIYNYPNNREAYIKKFGLKPLIEESENLSKNDNEVKIEKEKIIPSVLKEPTTVTSGNSKEEALKNIVDTFFSSIETEKNEVKTKNDTLEESIKNNEDEKDSINSTLEGIESSNESDPEDLFILQQISQIKPIIKTTDELVDSLESKRDLFKQLDLSDDEPKQIKEKVEEDDFEDELPLG